MKKAAKAPCGASPIANRPVGDIVDEVSEADDSPSNWAIVSTSTPLSPAAPSPSAPLAWSLGPYQIVFFSSACIMALELVAGRLIAPALRRHKW